MCERLWTLPRDQLRSQSILWSDRAISPPRRAAGSSWRLLLLQDRKAPNYKQTRGLRITKEKQAHKIDHARRPGEEFVPAKPKD
jgi:hypothetical protein